MRVTLLSMKLGYEMSGTLQLCHCRGSSILDRLIIVSNRLTDFVHLSSEGIVFNRQNQICCRPSPDGNASGRLTRLRVWSLLVRPNWLEIQVV